MSDSGDKENWELKTLEEIATKLEPGNGITRTQLGTGDYPAIKCGDINSGLSLHFTKCISSVNPKLIKTKKYFEYGDILISKMSNKKETIGTSVLYLGNDKPLAGNDTEIIKHNQNSKYLVFALSTSFCRKQIEELSQESTVFHLYSTKIKQIKIPLPPRHIQDKIADFLDQLLSLKEELKEELKERIKQYQYYRDFLIVGREEEGKRKGNLYHTQTIGEIATKMCGGDGVSKSQLRTGNFPAIKSGDISSGLPLHFKECISFVNESLTKNKKYFEYGDILISGLGSKETIGKAVTYLNKTQKGLLGKGVVMMKHNQNPKYLVYALSTDYCRMQMNKCTQQGIVFNLSAIDMKKIQIPLPSLDEQEKIVSILDKFHEMCGDITTGIPAIIEGTEKQYQYYRDRIFNIQKKTFKEYLLF